MADTIRAQIVAAIIAKLKTITTANGYKTELGSKVYEWGAPRLGAEDLPAAIVRDDTEDLVSEYSNARHEFILTVEIEVLTADAATAASIRAARDFITDVYKALGQDITLGGLALDIKPIGNELAHEKAEKTVGGGKASYAVRYRTAAYNPEAQ